MGALWSAGGDTSLFAAPRGHGNLSQGLHHDHLYSSAALFLFQAHLGYDRALAPRHIARWEPIQCKGQDVVAAELAGTKCREVRPQRIVRRCDVILDQVLDHSTAKAGVKTAPVKVDPVVPVRRMVWYWPTALAGRSSRTK
jgi:hypothetical protein